MMDVLCQKMPLSAMLRGLLERCFAAERLDVLFETHAREQYTRNLLFSTLCDLLLSVVLRVYPTPHAAYQDRRQDLNVSAVALYDKLAGVETQVTAALVRETARDLSGLLDALNVPRTAWLSGYTVRILDGNCLAASHKRLGVHAGLAAAALPGKSLVVLDPERQLMVDVVPCEDGHAQERSLVDQVLPSVQAGEVWIADRNFCTRGVLRGLRERRAYAVVRLHGGLPFTEITPFASIEGGDAGQRLFEQGIEVEGHPYRRIRIALPTPTRDGDYQLDVVTNLPETVAAATLASLYRKRWTLETAFQHLARHFASEIDTLAYPRAALFGFGLALVAYNVFSIMRAALDSAHDEPVSQTISSYYIAHQISATFAALELLSEATDWSFVATSSPAEFADWLRDVARNVRLESLKKHPRGPKKPRPQAPFDPKQPHVSTYKLLRERE
jgi:hypothetical protein